MKPARGLLQGAPYVSAAKTNLHKTFARIRRQIKAEQERKAALPDAEPRELRRRAVLRRVA